MFCPNCGNDLRGIHGSFCPNCGNNFSAITSARAEVQKNALNKKDIAAIIIGILLLLVLRATLIYGDIYTKKVVAICLLGLFIFVIFKAIMNLHEQIKIHTVSQETDPISQETDPISQETDPISQETDPISRIKYTMKDLVEAMEAIIQLVHTKKVHTISQETDTDTMSKETGTISQEILIAILKKEKWVWISIVVAVMAVFVIAFSNAGIPNGKYEMEMDGYTVSVIFMWNILEKGYPIIQWNIPQDPYAYPYTSQRLETQITGTEYQTGQYRTDGNQLISIDDSGQVEMITFRKINRNTIILTERGRSETLHRVRGGLLNEIDRFLSRLFA